MTEKTESILRKFFDYCSEKRLSRAVLKGIPYAGTTFDELIYGGDLESLIRHVHAETMEKQLEIIENLEALMAPKEQKTAPIVIFGSGNAEQVLYYDGELELGSKHLVTATELLGGSGVNYTMRLLAAGYEAIPILSIGQDRLGHSIQEGLAKAATNTNLSNEIKAFIKDEKFLVSKIRSAQATVVVHDRKRTIFSRELQGAEHYREHIEHQIQHISQLLPEHPSAVLIGHLNCDGPDFPTSAHGECTKMIIDTYYGRCPIFVNFGKSQLDLRYDFWKDILPRVSVMQFNLAEAKRFFTETAKNTSLEGLVDFLANEGITSVITIDRFGAVGNYQDGRDGIILAWPLIDREQIRDPTGAHR